jgi:hypothetical protein
MMEASSQQSRLQKVVINSTHLRLKLYLTALWEKKSNLYKFESQFFKNSYKLSPVFPFYLITCKNK